MPQPTQPVPDGEPFEPLSTLLASKAPEPTLARPESQLCTQNQFNEPAYAYWCAELKEPPRLLRKQWEFVYILQVLALHDMLAPGRRGLGFGCGKEPLASVMAKRGCSIVATDLDARSAAGLGWIETEQHASSLRDLNDRGICEPAEFEKRVVFRAENMNAISDDLRGFDFVWSSCAFEHLGSLSGGLSFVTNAMHCLRPGGLAIHTTEFNLTSNFVTFEDPSLAIFRKADIEGLAQTLTDAGHTVAKLNFNPGSGELDRYYDLPPYKDEPSLRLKLDRFVYTSIGLIIRHAT
jgi:2-polyprenyl-3-methyl-5-hydroxy-6-metoxy-1,4-benzoquinol methylase